MALTAKWDFDLNKFSRQMNLDVGTVKRKVALDLFTKITQRTPVDTGTLRNNWAAGDGGLPSPPNKGGGGDSSLGNFDVGENKEVTYIVNNLPYVLKMEFGGSRQAPSGMVRISVAEVITELQSTTERL
jgi:hypothetical protein